MARSKNSPALFEVIRNAQQKQREQLERQRQHELTATEASPAAALLRSPLYWFKGKHAHEAAHGTPIEPVMREVVAAERPILESRQPISRAIPQTVFDEPVMTESEPETPAAAAPPAISSFAAEHARQMREELAAQEAPASEPFFDSHSNVVEAGSDEAVSHNGYNPVDSYLSGPPASGQIALRFSYTTAGLAGVGILVVLALAYVIGSAGRSRDNRIATNAVRGDVLSIPTNNPPTNNSTNPSGNTSGIKNVAIPEVMPTPRIENPHLASTDTNGRTLGLDTIGRPIPVPTSVKRVMGLQYVVLLSFPRADDANELVKFLADNGVPATAEKALPGYSPSWYSVVTTRGFDHVRKNPDYDSYVASLGKLMQKYARGSKFKTFQPDVYSWRGN